MNRPEHRGPNGRPSPLGYLAAALAGGVLTLTAFGIGRATGGADIQVATTATAVAVTAAPRPAVTMTVAPAVTSTSTTTPAASTTVALLDVDPVARIAAAAGPAVVQIETGSGVGSGVVYRSDGYILTAAHVVDDPNETVLVRLADGRVFDGEILGAHDATDIAVVAIDATNLPVAPLALGRPLEIGQLAVALGSPFGFDQTVTAGVVSSVDRLVNGIAMVQTDAAINPGNSGGPLLDRAGAVIGINDLIFSTSGVSDGVGFAISIDLAALVAEQIVAGEEVELGFLGVLVSNETGAVPGAFIEDVETGSPADEAGLEVDDVVVSIDGELITNRDALGAKIIKRRPGDVVTLEVYRRGVVRTLEVTIGALRR